MRYLKRHCPDKRGYQNNCSHNNIGLSVLLLFTVITIKMSYRSEQWSPKGAIIYLYPTRPVDL